MTPGPRPDPQTDSVPEEPENSAPQGDLEPMPNGARLAGTIPLAEDSNAGDEDGSTDPTQSTGVPAVAQLSFDPEGGAQDLQPLSRPGDESAFTAMADASLAQTESVQQGLPGALISVATTLAGRVPVAVPRARGQQSPAEPPLLWAVLAFVRREISRSFFNKTPDAVADPVTTSEDTPKVIDALGNDVDDDTLTITGFYPAGQRHRRTQRRHVHLHPKGELPRHRHLQLHGQRRREPAAFARLFRVLRRRAHRHRNRAVTVTPSTMRRSPPMTPLLSLEAARSPFQ